MRVPTCVGLAAVLLAGGSCILAAQDSVVAPVAPRDTLPQIRIPVDSSHWVRPMGAFWRSFLIPGWGQAVTGRRTTGALFVAWEGTTLMMTLKAKQEVDYLESVGGPNLDSKKQEFQDWITLLIFNHFFAGAEAYVSAHLRDFPGDLKIQAGPRRIGVSLPLPRP